MPLVNITSMELVLKHRGFLDKIERHRGHDPKNLDFTLLERLEANNTATIFELHTDNGYAGIAVVAKSPDLLSRGTQYMAVYIAALERTVSLSSLRELIKSTKEFSRRNGCVYLMYEHKGRVRRLR